MEAQNYKNHIRYYTAHHFVFYPVIITLFVACIIGLCQTSEQHLLWLVLAGLTAAVGWLSFMVRQHYSLGNQNRIARMELRFRYYAVTHKRLEELESKLSLSQILALRFASDEELEDLSKRAVSENLSGDAIKRAVKNWVPDYMRV